jgi:hypothetical protein
MMTVHALPGHHSIIRRGFLQIQNHDLRVVLPFAIGANETAAAEFDDRDRRKNPTEGLSCTGSPSIQEEQARCAPRFIGKLIGFDRRTGTAR